MCLGAGEHYLGLSTQPGRSASCEHLQKNEAGGGQAVPGHALDLVQFAACLFALEVWWT